MTPPIKSRIGRIYFHIRTRCENPNAINYYLYGGKGIECEWKTFAEFYEDMGEQYKEHVRRHGEEKTSIERVDNGKNYCIANCRWATPAEQNRNTSQNHWITYSGKTQCLSDWAAELGIKRPTLAMRLGKYGWSVERALTKGVIR